MKILDWQKARCVDLVAEHGWVEITKNHPDPYTWANMPDSLREIQRSKARQLLEPLWPILEKEGPDDPDQAP